jgi:hypothetical protein
VNIFKAIVAALIVLAAPASAQDKKWYLGKIADWQLAITRSEGNPTFCEIFNHNDDGILTIGEDTDGLKFLYFWKSSPGIKSVDPIYPHIYFKIMSKKGTEIHIFEDVLLERGNDEETFFTLIGEDQRFFMKDLERGDVIHLMNGKDTYVSWSLDKSKKVIDHYEKCLFTIRSEV